MFNKKTCYNSEENKTGKGMLSLFNNEIKYYILCVRTRFTNDYNSQE